MSRSPRNRPKIGLALGPGGTKGAAHIGVLSVLLGQGLPIDCIAGASVGALYGACLAAGVSIHRLVEGLHCTPPEDVIDFYRHRLSLDLSTALGGRFYAALKGHDLRDLAIPFVAVAADLHRASPEDLRQGDLLSAVQASIAIPLIADPVLWDERYLVDGGFWEPAPVQSARALGADIVVAVSLGQPVKAPPRLRPALKGAARRLRDIALPGDRRAQIAFLLDVFADPAREWPQPDVLICPDVRRFSANSPYHAPLSFQRGVEAAKQALPTIQRVLRQAESVLPGA